MDAEPAYPLPKRVLVIDDDIDAAKMLAMYLDLEGHSVQTAGNARDGIHKLADFDADVILLDLRMPEMTGFEAARQIRGLHLPRRPLIVATTGCNGAHDRSACEDAGIDVHLAKPLELDVLSRLLASSLNPQ
jgi:two-component system, chemotaxis family, CheB/CheR fusion protein